ncbi:MAG: hypothetical protein ACK56F_29150, partial [bacterium]
VDHYINYRRLSSYAINACGTNPTCMDSNASTVSSPLKREKAVCSVQATTPDGVGTRQPISRSLRRLP